MGQAGIVGNDADVLLADDVAAEVGGEVDSFLVDHAQVTRLVVGGEELVAVAHLMNVAPAASVDGLEEAVLAMAAKTASQSRGYSRLRRERSVTPGGICLWGRMTVGGTATPSWAARA